MDAKKKSIAERERERDRQTGRQTDRQTDRDRDKRDRDAQAQMETGTQQGEMVRPEKRIIRGRDHAVKLAPHPPQQTYYASIVS